LGWWERLGAAAKTGLVLGAAALLGLGGWLASSAFAVEYRVLFSELAEADAAAIVERLQESNTDYRLANGGATILVPAAGLYDTRLSLMSGDTPLTGGIGFEIFDNQGLGATEQSQRVSYQRALQGELARTIATLDNVKQARVHLVLPDSTLFKRDTQEPRAAVTLQLKTAAVPSREQIAGVQRLVAASVAGLDAAKVVIVDQRGVTLSGLADLDAAAVSGEGRLTTKRDVEAYITRKITAVLDETYGSGRAIVSVDVTLNFDEIRRTVQDLLPVRAQSGDGRVLPRVQVNSGVAYDDPTWAIDTDGNAAARPGNSSTRVEYEYGRRIEQVIAAPGGVTRVSIGVIVPAALDAASLEQIREMVKVVAGVDEARGDEVIVRTLADLGGRRDLHVPSQLVAPPAVPAVPATDAFDAPALPSGPLDAGASAASSADHEVAVDSVEIAATPVGEPLAAPAGPSPSVNVWWLVAAAAALALVAAALVAFKRRRTKPELSAAERERLLEDIKRALGDDEKAGVKP
jgi:flagellar M-ring protein FliF